MYATKTVLRSKAGHDVLLKLTAVTWFLALAASEYVISAQASAALVRGQVTLQLPNGAVIDWEDVRVVIQSNGRQPVIRETETDRLGMYYFLTVPAGTYMLTVEAPDGQRQRRELHISMTDIHDVPPIDLKARRSYTAAFQEGVLLFEARKWKESIGPFREAIALQPSTDKRAKRVRISSRAQTVPYAPHYYLSAALLELPGADSCTAARNAIDIARNEVQGTGLEDDLAVLRKRPCP